MSGNILVAVDESKNSLRAVQYVADTVRTDAQITLLSVLPDATADRCADHAVERAARCHGRLRPGWRLSFPAVQGKPPGLLHH
ncbi:MAG: universal stress protein [Deltaproteobacteria bacterium]|nr:universal stress protein [Deltaproteobacteria bacterium]